MRKLIFTLILLSIGCPVQGQIVTGSIVGTVQDPGGLAVPDAAVTLVQISTGRERQTATAATGDFVFSGLDAGEYRMAVSKQGFKRYEKRDLVLPSGVRLPVGTLTLELGAVSETVSVTSERAIIQTQSAERADVITGSQIENLQIMGRNVPALVGLLPGVVMVAEPAGLDRGTTFSAIGNRRTSNQVTVDGLPSTDLGNQFELKLQQSMDSVAEVRILVSNYQAEYGNASGASVEMILKSGARDFHGLGSYYKRHEQFNANDFFNNRNSVPKPRYRYNTWSYNIGGPVFIPGRFNKNRDKLFFFWSQEFWPRVDAGLFQITVPTPQEREGDFSQSLDVSNRLILVRDPQNNRQPFPNNRIPANRLDKSGQALLKMFPAPNFFDRGISGGNYNFLQTTETEAPKKAYNLKMDYNFNPNNLLFVTFAAYSERNSGYTRMPGWNESFEQYFRTFKAGNKGLSGRYTRLFSPTISNEFHFGWFTNPETMDSPEEELKKNSRQTVGFTSGQFFPANNRFNFIPNATYGGVPNAANLTINGRFPIDDPYHDFNWTDKLSVIRGSHSLKMGVLVNWFMLGRGSNASQFGAFDFGRNVNNPLDTDYAYANGILGIYNTYTESSAIPYFNCRGGRVEWFVQDNWRVNKQLTLDYGIRMSRFTPIHDRDNLFSAFIGKTFDPAKQVRLVQPALNAQGQRVGRHPVTGELYAASLIGAVAPGVGDPGNGMTLAGKDSSLPQYLIKQRGWQIGPRVGFAYDPLGKGSTSIRGGIGFFYDQAPMNQWQPLTGQEPLVRNPTLYYGTLATLLSSSGFLFPTNVVSVDPEAYIPSVMNFSLSVQQNIGFSTVIDVGYVGSVARHLLWGRQLNAIPYGTNFLPQSNDPTTNRPMPTAFLRPLIGYNDIRTLEHAATSNYHSMQVSANRRFQRGLQFGVSWTWSKAMDYGSEDGTNVSPFVPVRVWNYGLATFDRTHNLKINFMYDLPNVGPRNAISRTALHGWQLSGILSFQSGAPASVSSSTTTSIDITGSPTEGYRPVITGDAVLPKGERTFDRFFRTDVFRLPAIGTYGNSARTQFRGPGINNWDLSIFKTFAIRESMRLQFRGEFYNAFNHTQFSGVNAAARFDPAGNQVSPTFGQMNAARAARIVQLALRFSF